jgi:PadR family transcriptional regulator, regulatory protein PadR
MGSKSDMLQGTLDLLVLKALQLGDLHGWGITDRIRNTSGDVLQVNQGSLYPSLYRLKKNGFIRSDWRQTENNRKARYYALTDKGRRALQSELAQWERLSGAVNRVIQTAAV